MARVLETDSNANLDISSAVAIGAYTADAARYVTTRVTVDQVSGSGDYLIYATVQDGGTGSAYRGIPITTATAAAGVTAILFVSSPIPMVSGDILTVYLDGLAGDTTNPDTKVIFFEQDYLRPTVAGRTLDVTATGEAGIDWSNIGAPTSTVALTDTTINTSTLESMIGSIGSGTGAAMNFADALNLVPVSGAVSGSVNYQLAAIRAHTDLLTSNATINVVAGSSGSEMSLVRGNTHSFTIGYTSSIGTPTEVWLGIKKSALYELDSEAELLVSSLSDLVYLARATPASGLVSGATFEYTAGVGFNFTCTAEVAALLTPGTYEYGIQWVSGGSINEGITGTCTISADIVRET